MPGGPQLDIGEMVFSVSHAKKLKGDDYISLFTPS